MAVTIGQLAAAIRLTDGGEPPEPQLSILTRLAGVADAFNELLIHDAPSVVQDECKVRFAAYLYDAPTAGRGDFFGNAWKNCGAAALASRWIQRRAAVQSGSFAPGAPGGAPGDDAYDWATEGNTDDIPVDKLQLAGAAATDALARAAAQAAQAAADAAQATADGKPSLAQATAQIATYARENNPSGHLPAERLGENPVEGTIPVVTTGGRTFRFTETSALGAGTDQTARNAAAAAQSAADAAQAAIDAYEAEGPPAVDATAREAAAAAQATADSHDDAATWAEEGNVADLVPTDKVNFDPLQVQIDEIADQIAHAAGPITSVVPTVGAGNDSLRYALPTTLDGFYDVSVRVKARVQINEFANISGNLRISEDGGQGLNASIPEKNHGYGHAHEGVLNFVRKGLAISPGVNLIDFTTLVTGNSPPDVHFVAVENLILTDTSLVNANNVDPLIALWAGVNIRNWALENAGPNDTPAALQLGPFLQADIDAIPLSGEQEFFYRALVQKDPDGTLAYIGGSWRKQAAAAAGGGGILLYRGDGIQPLTYAVNDIIRILPGKFAEALALYWRVHVCPNARGRS